jgi:nitrogenase molybdenum-iron protein alpha/beta subunit
MYVLDGHEVVFGCQAGLCAAIRSMAAAGAKYIMVLATCVPELIGEDIEGILREIREQVPVRLTVAFMGHFKGNSHPRGYWETLKALGNFMEPGERNPRRVNLLGQPPGDDPGPAGLFRLLEGEGICLRFLGPGSSLEDFLEAPDAALNLVLSPVAEPLALMMEKNFGIPPVYLHKLYDPGTIDRAYGLIAETLDLRWDDPFAAERQRALLLEQEAAERMSGLRGVFGPIGLTMPIPLAAYLARLGLRPLLLHIEDFYPSDIGHAGELKALGFDPPVCHMANLERDIALVENLAPDLCLGTLPAGGAIRTLPGVQGLYGQFGYERTSSLLEMILNALNRPPVLKGRP